MSLSTSSFKKSLLKASDLLTVLIIIVAIDVVLHINESNWFESLNFGGDFRSKVIEKGIQKAKHKPQIAVLGSSVTSAMDEEILASATGKTAERFLIFSANPTTSRRILDEMILVNFTPEFAIYITSPRDWTLSENVDSVNATIPDLDAYTESPWLYQVNRWIRNNFLLVGYRDRIHQYGNDLITNLGSEDKTPSENKPQPRRKGRFINFNYDPLHFNEIESMMALCQKSGTQLIIAAFQTHPDPLVTSPEFAAEVQKWMAHLEAQTERYSNTYFLDLVQGTHDPENYKDTHHANEIGAAVWSKKVSEVINSLER